MQWPFQDVKQDICTNIRNASHISKVTGGIEKFWQIYSVYEFRKNRERTGWNPDLCFPVMCQWRVTRFFCTSFPSSAKNKETNAMTQALLTSEGCQKEGRGYYESLAQRQWLYKAAFFFFFFAFCPSKYMLGFEWLESMCSFLNSTSPIPKWFSNSNRRRGSWVHGQELW